MSRFTFYVLRFTFCTLLLFSCRAEQGDYTAVSQKGEYVYGVWKAHTAKEAKKLLDQMVHTKIKETQPLESLPIITTTKPMELLPSKEVSHWVQSRNPSKYTRENLYKDVIGGNPELYHSYGFIEQANVEYQNRRLGSKPLIIVEIFDMGSVENAYGIYSFNRYPQDEFEWVGNKAMISGKYLSFWKGKYLIQIEGYEFATAIKAGMIELAEAVANQIKDPPTKPHLVKLLPKMDKIANSEKYFSPDSMLQSPLNFLSFEGVVPRSPQLETNAIGVSAAYRHKSSLTNLTDTMNALILRYPSESEAKVAYQAYRRHLQAHAIALDEIKTGGFLARGLNDAKQ